MVSFQARFFFLGRHSVGQIGFRPIRVKSMDVHFRGLSCLVLSLLLSLCLALSRFTTRPGTPWSPEYSSIQVGGHVMARKVECLCGRVFHVPNSASQCQCSRCGRTWHEVDLVGAVCCAMFGEVANTPKVQGDRRRSKKRKSTGRQTSLPRPRRNDRIGSMRSLFKAIGGR